MLILACIPYGYYTLTVWLQQARTAYTPLLLSCQQAHTMLKHLVMMFRVRLGYTGCISWHSNMQLCIHKAGADIQSSTECHML